MKERSIEIDSKYLKEAVQRSAMSTSIAGVKCGLGTSTISTVIRKGYCHVATAQAIALSLGIDYERLTKVQKQEQGDYLKADDKAVAAMVNALCAIDSRMQTIERKMDRLLKELGCVE